MSSGQQPSSQQTPPTWTEPPWCGWIETTGDALLILEAARRGLIPRVTRRLVDSERKMITSGSVFVFDEDESGIKRWTDGFFWSPSRILGNFLLYRETDKRGAGHRSIRADQELNGESSEGQSLSRPRNDMASIAVDKHRERSLVGSLTNSYKFKPDGLMKKTFSLAIGGVAQHLISYYKIEDVESGRLRSPSSLPELASLEISPEYLDKTHFRSPPKVEVDSDGRLRYCGEADEVDVSASSNLLTGPLSSPSIPPLLTEGRVAENSKRGKRYDPYGSSVTSGKRPRKNTKSSSQEATSPSVESAPSPVAGTSSIPAQTAQPSPSTSAYPEVSAPASLPPTVPHGYPSYGIPGFYPGYPPPPGHPYGPAVAQPSGVGPPYIAPPPVAVSSSASSSRATPPQTPGNTAPIQYTPYPSFSSAPPGAGACVASPSNHTTTAATSAKSMTQPSPSAGPLPQGGQVPYPQSQQQYYPYYPPPPHPSHMHLHTYPPPIWGQYPSYGPPPPPLHHHRQPSVHGNSQPPPLTQSVIQGHPSASTPYQHQDQPQARNADGRDDEAV